MKFLAFRIRNYRSIIDSDWNNLAYDNITGLIGQNESGKTSVLEALNSFYIGAISDNVLRSDLSMPEINCSFTLDIKFLEKKIEKNRLPDGVSEILNKNKKCVLTRKWTDERNNKLFLDDEEINEIYRKIKDKKESDEKTLSEKLNSLSNSIELIKNESENQLKEKQIKEKELQLLTGEEKSIKDSLKIKPTDKELLESHKITVTKINQYKKDIEDINKKYNTTLNEIKIYNESSKFINKFSDLAEKLNRTDNEKIVNEKDIKELQSQREFANSPRQKRVINRKITSLYNALYEKDSQIVKLKNEYEYYFRIISKIFEGKLLKEAEKEVIKERDTAFKIYDREDLAKIIYDELPFFEFFEDFSSLLPDRIDLEDIVNKNYEAEGYKAATNYLTIAGLAPDFFSQKNDRILKQKIENLNNEINIDFHEYWRQKVGKESKIKIYFELEHYNMNHPDKKGKPYIEFWIKDENERLYPKQRSRGVRWFISFYLELKAAAAKNHEKSIVMLIDEPGVSLHARAQEDVLKVFEDIKDHVQIIYSTHSPHLIHINKLYRLLAVQRAVEDDDYSETVIFSAENLNSASTDTLSPIYTLMGTRISEQQVIQKKNNVILEDVATYYYMISFLKLLKITSEVYFLPATDVFYVPTLVNILLGWKLDFIVVLDDDNDGNRIHNELKKQLFWNNDDLAEKKLIMLDKCRSIEDVFSTIDFKKYILHKRVGITESNSEYIEDNNLSRPVLASTFLSYIEKNNLSVNDFDEETRNNIQWIVNRLINVMK